MDTTVLSRPNMAFCPNIIGIKGRQEHEDEFIVGGYSE
jgi:hypothetical protein